MRIASIALTAVVMAGVPATLLRAEDQANTAEYKPSTIIPAEKDRPRHEGFLKDKEEQLKKGPIQVVFIGDSITDGWRGKGGKQVWDEHFGKYNPLNLGISGDRTEHVLWRIDHGELDGLDPKAVVIMIGTNNLGSSSKDIATGTTAVAKAVHEKLPKAKILLLAVFPRGKAAADMARDRLTVVNEHLAKLNGQDNITFLDIGQKFLQPDGTLPPDIMPDALHPNEKGYQIWAEAIDPTLEELTK